MILNLSPCSFLFCRRRTQLHEADVATRVSTSDSRSSSLRITHCGKRSATPLWLCCGAKTAIQPVAQRAQSALLAREGGLCRRSPWVFGQLFVATSVVAMIAMTVPPNPSVGLGISDGGGKLSSRLRSWSSMRNVHLTPNLSPCSFASLRRPEDLPGLILAYKIDCGALIANCHRR